MKICKWAGDPADEYCKSCDGISMTVDGLEKSCSDCAGYEEGEKEAATESEVEVEVEINDPVEQAETAQKPTKASKPTNTTPKKEKPVKTENTKAQKVSQEKHVEENEVETPDGIQVTALRYTSSATVKRGDNYFKFTAEEEWDTSLYDGDIQDVREQLWAKLNSEVDKQIEDLSAM